MVVVMDLILYVKVWCLWVQIERRVVRCDDWLCWEVDSLLRVLQEVESVSQDGRKRFSSPIHECKRWLFSSEPLTSDSPPLWLSIPFSTRGRYHHLHHTKNESVCSTTTPLTSVELLGCCLIENLSLKFITYVLRNWWSRKKQWCGDITNQWAVAN